MFDTDAALDKAVRLFWQRGYEATSMADLVAETGVAAASLYAAFDNKAGLFAAVIERYAATLAAAGLRAADLGSLSDSTVLGVLEEAGVDAVGHRVALAAQLKARRTPPLTGSDVPAGRRRLPGRLPATPHRRRWPRCSGSAGKAR